MVRGRSVGFITSSADNRTIAHELGHGVFGLEHTFPEIAVSTTNNLMDYGTSTHLTHEQWKIIHARKPAYSWFDKEEDGAYETDGHYSTVYLVSLMLGMDKTLALELAKASEAPDTKIHSEMDFELNDTWASPLHQGPTHALTGGFHGIEEFMSAMKFLYTNKSDMKTIGEMLHRFGDSYAHTKLDNILPSDLLTYQLGSNPQNIELAIKSWKGQGSQTLSTIVEPWISFFNAEISRHGMGFMTDTILQKNALFGNTLQKELKNIYSVGSSGLFKMYGNKYYTKEHAINSDKLYPDLIYMRPEWYLNYVKNLAWLISRKYNLDDSKLDLTVFQRMVNFAKVNKCSLKGIIDYEIAKKKNEAYVFIPVFYSTPDGIAASLDAVFISDYLQVAKDATEMTEKYIKQEGKFKFVMRETQDVPWWKVRVNTSSGFFTTLAYKLYFYN